jgi:hypothetical protein
MPLLPELFSQPLVLGDILADQSLDPKDQPPAEAFKPSATFGASSLLPTIVQGDLIGDQVVTTAPFTDDAVPTPRQVWGKQQVAHLRQRLTSEYHGLQDALQDDKQKKALNDLYEYLSQQLKPELYFDDHENLVCQAMARGDVVPAAVLADYPNLTATSLRLEQVGAQWRGITLDGTPLPPVKTRQEAARVLVQRTLQGRVGSMADLQRQREESRLGDLVHAFLVPEGRPAIVASEHLVNADYQFAVRPVLDSQNQLHLCCQYRLVNHAWHSWPHADLYDVNSYDEAVRALVPRLTPDAQVYDPILRDSRHP